MTQPKSEPPIVRQPDDWRLGSRARQLNVNTAYMCGRSLADRCQRAGCDARYSPLPGLPRSNGTTASRHRRPQVPLSRNYRRAMPPAIAGAGERPLGPFRRPLPWHAAKPRRRCLRADRETPRHSHRCGHRSERRISSCCSCFPCLTAFAIARATPGRRPCTPGLCRL